MPVWTRGIPVLCEKPLTTAIDSAYPIVQREAGSARPWFRSGSCGVSTPSTSR